MEKAPIKTTLVPGAPWPVWEEPKPKKVYKQKVFKPKPVKISATSKIKRTNDNFEKWRKKNSDVDLSSILSRK